MVSEYVRPQFRIDGQQYRLQHSRQRAAPQEEIGGLGGEFAACLSGSHVTAPSDALSGSAISIPSDDATDGWGICMGESNWYINPLILVVRFGLESPG